MSGKTNKVPGKRGRKSLSEQDKAHMAERRVEAAAEKKAAIEAIKTNPQFTNPKMWGHVPVEKVQAIMNAINQGGEKARKAKLAELKAQVAALEGTPAQAFSA